MLLSLPLQPLCISIGVTSCLLSCLLGEPAAQPCLPCPVLQEHERLRLQAQQLQAQLAKKEEEGREGNLRLAQLQAALEERTQALEAAQVRCDSRVQDRLAVTPLSARLLSCTCAHWCCVQLLCTSLAMPSWMQASRHPSALLPCRRSCAMPMAPSSAARRT